MKRSILPLLALAASLPAHAYACGGCFSPPAPQIDQTVVQNAERVLFMQDPATQLTTVWVEVRYSGLAKDFGWVLPVPKLPTIGVGNTAVLDALDAQMAMRYAVTTSAAENCRDPYEGCVEGHQAYPSEGAADASAGADESSDAGGTKGGGGGVQILAQGTTGPYDYVVVKSTDAQTLYSWLTGHGYALPGKAKPIIQSHIDQGNVFVAVHLTNGAGVDAIKPITMQMQGADPCVPLRLTSIASADELNVLVTIAGPGRAVPKNHLSVEMNPLRMTLNSYGFDAPLACLAGTSAGVACGRAGNFDQVESAAIDEAGGRAFVTESSLAGADVKLDAIVAAAQYTELAGVTNLLALANVLAQPDWQGKLTGDLADALDPVLKLEAVFPTVSPLQALADLRACAQYFGNPMGGGPVCASDNGLPAPVTMTESQLAGIAVDGAALSKALQDNLGTPLATVQKLLAGSARVTRLAMKISPSEMDRDPIFAFNPTLPIVQPQRPVQVNQVCTSGWLAPYSSGGDSWRLSVDGLGSWVVANGGQLPQDARFVNAPLALAIHVLEESGAPVDIAASDVPVVSAAIAGAKPGQVSLPANLVLKTPAPWLPAPSDPLVNAVVGWPQPQYGCTPKACWVDGAAPPAPNTAGCGDADAGPTDGQAAGDAGPDVTSGPVPGVDSANGWLDSGTADASAGAQKSGCQASRTDASRLGVLIALAGAGLLVRRRRLQSQRDAGAPRD